MKAQSPKAKLDESLGVRKGAESTKKQSMKDRRHESEGAHDAHHHHSMIKHHLSMLHKMAKAGNKHHKAK